MLRLLARLVAAALVAAAAVVVLPTAPATAAFCGADGVSTVVDPGSLGGGVSRQCGPGPSAATAFADDHDLQDHPRQPGFICRIDGAPGDGDCLRNDAYWALFVSEDGGPWVYASAGADGQSVDDGDAVAFVWQSTSSRRSPGVAPPAAPAPTAVPTKQPSAKPTTKPTRSTKPTKPSKPGSRPSGPASADPTQPTKAPPSASTPTAGSASPSASPSTSPSTSASGSTSASPSGTASSGDPVASPTDESDTPVAPSSADTTADDGGVPLWLVLVMLALLLVATLTVLVHRRRTARTSGP